MFILIKFYKNYKKIKLINNNAIIINFYKFHKFFLSEYHSL